MHAHDWPKPDADDWRTRAACAGYPYEFFTPKRGNNRGAKAVRELCGACPVRVECRAWAVSEVPWDDPAVYAGLSREERNAARTGREVRR